MSNFELAICLTGNRSIYCTHSWYILFECGNGNICLQVGFGERVSSVPPTSNVYSCTGDNPYVGVYHAIEVSLLCLHDCKQFEQFTS